MMRRVVVTDCAFPNFAREEGAARAGGADFVAHPATESVMPTPPEPILLMKATTAVSGPCHDRLAPRGSSPCDREVELGVVIGREAKYVGETEAISHVGVTASRTTPRSAPSNSIALDRGLGRRPTICLKASQTMRLGIEGLGEQRRLAGQA